MRCICPHCGRKIENSEDLVFDLTKICREKIGQVLGKYLYDIQNSTDQSDGGITLDNNPDAGIRMPGFGNPGKDAIDVPLPNFHNSTSARPRGEKQSTEQLLKSGESTFFSDEVCFTLSEKTISSMPLAEEEDLPQEGYVVNFTIDAEQLIEQYKNRRQDDGPDNNDVTEFIKWLKKKSGEIAENKAPLWLLKEGEGDIRFNMIRDARKRTKITDVRLCPYCKGKMSFWAGRYPEVVLTVLGGPRTSKSTTMTACVASFMGNGGPIRWSANESDEGWQEFQEFYLDKYREGKPIDPTRDKGQIPKVSFEVDLGEGKGKICLTFIDVPGEFNDEEGVDEKIYADYSRFYQNIDFIWYCTDPGEVNQIAGEAQENPALQELGYEEKTRIISTARLRKNMENLSPLVSGTGANGSGRVVPVLYILGKTDVSIISDEEKAQFSLYDEEENNAIWDALDLEAYFERARRTREYIRTHNREQVQAFEEKFRYRSYVAISAYGYNPKKETGRAMRPYQCRVPFYWMLAILGMFEIRVRVREDGFFRKRWVEMTRLLDDFEDEELRNNILKNLYMVSDSYIR